MFTGIIERPCPLLSARSGPHGRRLQVDLSALGGQPSALGDSVAINGVCLTVADLEGARASFDVVPETLSCTNLGGLQAGALVHVERALRCGDRLDGHLVQGHVEGTGTVRKIRDEQGQTWLEVDCGRAFASSCMPKGSVAVDGVSLTIAELGSEYFAVALVPHTLARTTLGQRRVGELVNLEADLVGRWVARLMQAPTR